MIGRLDAKQWQSATLIGVAFASGCCVVSQPLYVYRTSADYNTERRYSIQGEVFEHLPLPAWRVQLMQWGYNVNPVASSASVFVPPNSPVAKPTTLPDVPPVTDDAPDLLDRARPPAPILKPGTNETPPNPATPSLPSGPTASRDLPIHQTGYRAAQAGAAAGDAAWLFRR